MNFCPCCKDILLCHAHTSGIDWFCRSCWQTMPVCTHKQSVSSLEMMSGELPAFLNQLKKVSFIVPFRRKEMVISDPLSPNLSAR